MSRRVVFTADDFGFDQAINEAVEEAHRNGVLTSASLMVTAPAAADAVERARRMPSLAVGLHLVLVQGIPALSTSEVGPLLDSDGRFLESPAKAGLRYFFRSKARAALAAEIRAQFEAFRRTGLPLDHVDGHTHLHIHPKVFSLLLEIGPEYGMRAMRVPYEEPWASWRAAGSDGFARLAVGHAFAPWAAAMKSRLQQAGLVYNDSLFGFHDTGRMRRSLVRRQLELVENGSVTEFYFHPATRRSDAIERAMPGYLNVEEFEALTSAELRETLLRLNVVPVAFRDM